MSEELEQKAAEVFHVLHWPSGTRRIALQTPGMALLWNSRSHRKGRNPLLVSADGRSERRAQWELFGWQPGNLSWWVAFLFTVGSIVWLGNGWIAVWPVENAVVQAWTSSLSALVGGFVFILGAVAAFWECVNRPPFVHAFVEGQARARSSHHGEYLLEHPLRFAWFSLEHHNWAWWLNMLQLIGALVFFVACVVGMLLPVHLRFDETGWYWMPQMIGAVFFLASSVMAMLEVQDAPWKPAWNKIGWYSAFFNGIGAVGFFLCAFFGAFGVGAAAAFWGSDVSTFWGSAAFLISSYLMLVEVLNP